MYICPVCGFDQLQYPPDDGIICPSCGTQFGYTDANVSHDVLLAEWLLHGAHWHSKVIPKPANWNPYEQLYRAGLLELEPSAASQRTIGYIEFGNGNAFVDAELARVNVHTRIVAFGETVATILEQIRLVHA